MFKKSQNEQVDLFTGLSAQLSKGANKKLMDSRSWNQVFWHHFVSKVDEQPYEVLYADRMGRPNTPIRQVIGMMVIKELNGWSDEQLFEESMFNLRVRSALGIANMDSTPPVASTYYKFRSMLAQYQIDTGKDLIEQTFDQVSAQQIKELDISGQKIRMDSKLIQSNIARQNRVQLVVEALRVGIKHIDISDLLSHVSETQRELLTQLQDKSTSNVTYPLDKQSKATMLEDVGLIIYTMIQLDMLQPDSTLYRLYEQQYEQVDVVDDNDDSDDQATRIQPRDSKTIKSDTIQSVHDQQASYRKKGKGEHVQIVKGYHSNITETCGEAGQPNLITNVITTPAHVSESDYLQEAIARSEEKLPADKAIEEVITDGGYDSIDNRQAMSQASGMSWKMHKLKGGRRAYDIYRDDSGALIVKDRKTKEQLTVTWSEKVEKYRVQNSNGTYRYFTKDQIASYLQSLEFLQNSTDDDYNLRSSVESTIHEVFHRIGRRQKIRYRGLIKCQWYVLSRALAVNLNRIGRNIAEKQSKWPIFIFTALMSHLSTYVTILFTPRHRPANTIILYARL